jgi:UDP-N-acetylmuramoyl-L-alanyl-D-glutamate--2,6-diaminopimelate ligase
LTPLTKYGSSSPNNPGLFFAGAMSFLIRSAPPVAPSGRKLADLFDNLGVRPVRGDWPLTVRGISTDSRRVTPGALFFALPGLQTDGFQYIGEAMDRGAVAIVSEHPTGLPKGVASIVVADIRGVLAEVSRKFYGEPERDLELVGITGTNGKTTVAYLVQHLLAAREGPVGMLGTVKYDLGGRTLPAFRTTPESVDIYAMLAQMRSSGCRRAVLEVSSHGLEQRRLGGIPFKVGVFLNLTRDHLDYHGSMEAYYEAKKRMFVGGCYRGPEIAIVNLDDPFGARLASDLAGAPSRLVTFGERPDADYRVFDVRLGAAGSSFSIAYEGRSIRVNSGLPGRYNVSNTLAAFAVGNALDGDGARLAAGIGSFQGVEGRMERVEAGPDIHVFVDYAHTDNALGNALSMLRTITEGRLLVVFGCGGNRDRTKRPLMTAAALRHGDFVWATADNPRSESVTAIFDDMRSGLEDVARIRFVEDRRRAISLALDEARAGDCVLIAGKGHETFQEFADTVVPFDDRLTARELLDIKWPPTASGPRLVQRPE